MRDQMDELIAQVKMHKDFSMDYIKVQDKSLSQFRVEKTAFMQRKFIQNSKMFLKTRLNGQSERQRSFFKKKAAC